jgi:hypothetical protein
MNVFFFYFPVPWVSYEQKWIKFLNLFLTCFTMATVKFSLYFISLNIPDVWHNSEWFYLR